MNLAAPLPEEERTNVPALVLAALVHLLLIGALFFGVQWKSQEAASVAVELWSAPPPSAVRPPPVVEPKPEPKPEPKKPDPREAARAEAQARAEQARLDKIRADKEARDAKVAAERSRALEERRMRELMAHDSEHAKQSGEIQKELARIANEKAKASDSRALKAYADKIAAKVRGNIILPPGVSGNPVGVFYVDQLPDGSVIEVRLKRSTGNAQLDAAIERAIQKSSPLPKPDRAELFQRTLNFEFYPLRD